MKDKNIKLQKKINCNFISSNEFEIALVYCFMLKLLDFLLTLVHLSIIMFNLFGWIPKRTRKAHIVSVALTTASWFILGIWYGVGYCPFTDWQWKVKEQLGEKNLPGNFVEYFLEKLTGYNFSPTFINTLIAVCFFAAVILSLFVNFVVSGIKRKRMHARVH